MFGFVLQWWGSGSGRNQPAQPVFRATADVAHSLLPGEAEMWQTGEIETKDGRLPVREAMEAQHWEQEAPLILVTGRDLTSPGCSSLFGFANPGARVAVVSTFRLAGDGDERLGTRLGKVIAHEWMHLRGYGHCRHPECLMHPVRTVRELDDRGETLCVHCRERRKWYARLRGVTGWFAPRWRALAAAVAVVVAVSGGLDLTVQALRAKSRPFTWRERGDAIEMRFRGSAVLRVPASPLLRDDIRRATDRLNVLFAEIDPPPLRVADARPVPRIYAGKQTLLAVSPAVAGDTAPAVFAHRWIARIDPLLQGKGTARESCPDCHIRRRAQVRETIANPPRIWR